MGKISQNNGKKVLEKRHRRQSCSIFSINFLYIYIHFIKSSEMLLPRWRWRRQKKKWWEVQQLANEFEDVLLFELCLVLCKGAGGGSCLCKWGEGGIVCAYVCACVCLWAWCAARCERGSVALYLLAAVREVTLWWMVQSNQGWAVTGCTQPSACQTAQSHTHTQRCSQHACTHVLIYTNMCFLLFLYMWM